jgi:3-hydroxy-3-methylglutaryl CoA synthase
MILFADLALEIQLFLKRILIHPSFSLRQHYYRQDGEKTFMALTKSDFSKKVLLSCAPGVGNMYCASVFGGIISLLSRIPSSDAGRRSESFLWIRGFLLHSMYSMTVCGDTTQMSPVYVISETEGELASPLSILIRS